ncbi:MAG: aminotransferase class III-fold pyridoxal phosphate-dependent enzyme, partial [Acidimicrobiales bacterium]
LLEVIESEGLIPRAAELGAGLLADLQRLATDHPGLASNARGRGLMCAVDLPSAEQRDQALQGLRADEHVLALGCGERSIRFRPALSVSAEELSLATAAVGRVLTRMEAGA